MSWVEDAWAEVAREVSGNRGKKVFKGDSGQTLLGCQVLLGALADDD